MEPIHDRMPVILQRNDYDHWLEAGEPFHCSPDEPTSHTFRHRIQTCRRRHHLRVLTQELAPRSIRVNCINPGLVDTEGSRSAGFFGSNLDQGFASPATVGRADKPHDLAYIARFLAGDESGWVTGESILANQVQDRRD
jgi:hypothetical protein